MRTIHAFMHHKDTGLNSGAFAGLENHRTDGELWGSAPLQNFDIWRFFETQTTITCIRDLDGKGFFYPKFHIPVIDLLLIYSDRWAPTAIPIGKEKRGDDKQNAA
jgi:hypothetical protein